ncbi:GSCFA domain-containing protein [Flavobacterium sp. H122]|uniref:GSCFA domain-containing protein n=1 Tax=Flavobacterium sp. H122 TaxID=2529860 RepID=UPI0010AAED8F|nr:GSCFA domain-containing protein [Flavobacterium sp. H122]
MQFRTEVPVTKSNFPMDYTSGIMLLGSCFAENMGDKFEYFKFQNSVNPFGIIFNPVSIEKLIKRCVDKTYFTEKDIFYHNEAWHCFEVHSELSNLDKDEFLLHLNALIESTNQQINKSTHFIITLGTVWIYRNLESHQIVANCHKVMQKHFIKELLSVEVVEKSLQNIIQLVTSVNADAKFIFTVSPVRHIKDGFAENQVSKANLLVAVYKIVNCQQSNTNYFPSYEIMMDELRDYRFYAEDMLHPNQTAIDYIWIKFFENYVKEEEFKTMQEVCDIQKALHHRPFNPNSESHHKFLKSIDRKISAVREKLPFAVFDSVV